MMYIRYPLSLRQVEDILAERGIDICYETVRFWWNRIGPLLAAEIRKRRIRHRSFSHWRRHLDEVFVKINGVTPYLWRAVDREGEVLEVYVTKERDHRAALRFLKRTMTRYRRPNEIVTDRLRSYRPTMTVIGNAASQERGGGATIELRICAGRFDDVSGRWQSFGRSKPFRSLLPPTPQSTTTSI